MGFSFLFKRDKDTVYYWEKNDWYRKHGYNLPFNLYLIMQWVFFVLFDFGFFYFLINFSIVYENNSNLTTSEMPIENLYQKWKDANAIQIDPFSTWSCKISFFIKEKKIVSNLLYNVILFLTFHLLSLHHGCTHYTS